jgi:TPR repeat protein
MSRPWQQVMGLVFVLTGFLTIRAGEKQNQLNARSFANVMRQAQLGDRRAQTQVGIAFAKGEIVERNPSEAVRWFSEAAMAGDPIAQHNLGVRLYLGSGVERNLAQAAKWFEAAATAGLPEAQFNAACMYEAGLGVRQNLGRALALFQEAARQGHAPAQNDLGRMYQKGEGIAQDFVAAVKCRAKDCRPRQSQARRLILKPCVSERNPVRRRGEDSGRRCAGPSAP